MEDDKVTVRKRVRSKAAATAAPAPSDASVMPDPVISEWHRLGLVDAVQEALAETLEKKGKLADYVLNIDGMSGIKYRYFINNLIGKIENPRYLEVGSWSGSTLCAAINNNAVRALAIDNWSQFGGPAPQFFNNVANSCSPLSIPSVISDDFRNVDFRAQGSFNVYLFDGPHEHKDHYDGLALAMDALTEEFVFIVDDWNWSPIRNATLDAIRKLNLDVLYKLEIRTTEDDNHATVFGKLSDWHNGYFISVLKKTADTDRALRRRA